MIISGYQGIGKSTLAKNSNKYIEPTNKSLYSIYNYIHLNNFSKNNDDYNKIHNENKNECIVDLRDSDDEHPSNVEKQKKRKDKLIWVN